MSSFPCRNNLLIIQGGLRLFKADILESVVFLLILASVGLTVISSCIVHGRMLQENEEVHQMSSDNNQKTETRYVAVPSVKCCGKGPAQC